MIMGINKTNETIMGINKTNETINRNYNCQFCNDYDGTQGPKGDI